MPERKHVAETAVSRQEETMDRVMTKKRAAREIGGYKGPEPTRFGDWEKKGRCIDF